jgi:phage shock protein PspC (stress-responsive transcriptional regulator)
MLGGVAAGIARYLDVDVTVIRILFAALTLIGGAAIPVYLAAWLLIPEDGADQSIAAGLFQSRAS